LIFQILTDYIWSIELKNQGKMSIKSFIRGRILSFPVLVLFLVNLAKKSLQVSLNQFCDVCDLTRVTKQALSKARKNLSAQVFVLLNRKLLEEYYSDNGYSTWKGFRVIAIDGSDIQLPQKESLKLRFGSAKNGLGPNLAMATISCAYDVLNHKTLDGKIDAFETPERDLAVQNIESIDQLHHDKTKDLYILDRGYPSLGLLFYLKDHNKDFIIRCSTSSCFSKVKAAFENGQKDIIVRLQASEATHQQRVELNKRVPSLDIKNAYVDVRMIVVLLDTGEKELLLTSLLDKKLYPHKEFKGLYGLRWRKEENYKWFKVGCELENFNGHTELAIQQEFFALILTANMASLVMEEAQDEIDEEHKAKGLKYEYKINKRIAIGTLKDKLVVSLMDRSLDMEEFCEDLKSEFKKNLCPIRAERKYGRLKKSRRKYGCTQRSCL
jgi:hypothetical protein